MSHSYRELRVWQLAMELVEQIYRITETFPAREIYGLTSQLRKAAVSVPSNIAEGQGRSTAGEFRQFLANARGSLFEVETQLVIAARLGYVSFRSAGYDIGESGGGECNAQRPAKLPG